METWPIVEGVGSAIGGVATVATVLYGVGTFKRQRDSASISALRTAVQEIRELLTRIDDELHDTNYMGISYGIAKSFRSAYRGEETGAAFLQWLKAMPNELAIGLMSAAGYDNPVRRRVTSDARTALSKVLFLDTEFPAVAHVLRHTVTLASKGAIPLVSFRPYRSFFEGDRAALELFCKDNLTKAANMEQVEILFAYALASLCSIQTRVQEQRDFDAMEAIAEAFSTWVKRANDGELRNLLKSAPSQLRKINRIKTDKHTGEIRAAAEILKPFVGKAVVEEVNRQCSVFESPPDFSAFGGGQKKGAELPAGVREGIAEMIKSGRQLPRAVVQAAQGPTPPPPGRSTP
jgi:hypothetical protein